MREKVGGGCMDELSGWKEEIIKNCRLWIESLPEDSAFPEPEEEPDLYSFYEQLCVLKSEFKKNSRRTHETFSQLGDHLEGFQDVLGSLRQRLDALSIEKESTEILNRQRLFLQVVEIYERLRRFGDKLKETEGPPQADSESSGTGLRHWIMERLARKEEVPLVGSGAVTEGFFLALSHFEDFLAGEGISRISTTGKAFDPSLMIAMGTVAVDADTPDMVFEEIEGGYMYDERVLKLAKVTVTKRKEP